MTKPSGGSRADVFLVEHGHASTRAEAQAAIKSGRVEADGKPVTKPAQMLHAGQKISFEKEHPYVSRGALKLIAALDHFGFLPKDRICLDIGASTGGFTEVLLERGAARVVAVDVGHGQLDWRLRTDPRVVVLERTNARHLTAEALPKAPQLVVCDASFIGLRTVLPAALGLAAPAAELVALIKPQFEAGPEAVGKGGVVRDAAVHEAVCASVRDWLEATLGWTVLGLVPSPILGPKGNREFLIGARKPR
jgi:23S rRNA (cytidine1920-2'-O)/16S rRNA (cytidine1409-2'-O)-methyltransferase